MDAFQLLEEARDVVLADEATIDAAVDLVLTAAFADTGPSRVGSVPKHRRRRLVVGGTVLAVIAAGALVADLVAPFGSGRGGAVPSPRGPQRSTTVPIRTGGGRDSSAVLAASTVRRIAAASTAVANSGTAVVTETTSTGTPPVTQTMTTDVTFSGTNVNYTIATDSAGAQGVENRYVGGQLYLYVKGPDLQMHWYHTLDPGTGTGHTFFDPRTLFHALSSQASFKVVGQQAVDGQELTHLQATTPGSVASLGIPNTTGAMTSLDVWIDQSDVVHRMTVVYGDDTHTCSVTSPPRTPNDSSTGTTVINGGGRPRIVAPEGSLDCPTVPGSRTVTVAFADLGAPEPVTVPAGAIPQHALG